MSNLNETNNTINFYKVFYCNISKIEKGLQMFLRYIIISMFFTIGLLGNSSFGSIVSGSKTGTYYKVANDISTIFKKYKANLNVIPTKGSVDNLNALTGKNEHARATWAIVQSDALDYYSFLHFKSTKKEVTDIVKTILPLYTEHIHIFAKKGKKIEFKKGTTLRVGVSSKTSGSNITANLIENAYKVNFKYRYVNFKTALKYLQNDKLDIIINVISYPNANFQKLKNVSLVNLPQNKIMNKKYIRSKFSKARYTWLKKDVHSYKVPSVLITNRVGKKYNQTVGIYLKIILNNYKSLIKYGHPVWREAYRNRTLKVNNMHPVAFQILHK